jgi:ankyrin repeat protein
MNSFITWFRDCLNLRRPALIAIALAWTSFAFSGEIHDAALNGDVEKVKALLKANPGLVFDRNYDEETPLDSLASRHGLAISFGNNYGVNGTALNTPPKEKPIFMEIATLLIVNGANVNGETNHTCPLLNAVNYQNWSLAKLLIEKGANVNVTMVDYYDNRMTPLHYAARYNNIEVAKLLLAHKASINAKAQAGWTPLHWAAVAGHMEMVALLLDKKADVNAKTDDGDGPPDFRDIIGMTTTAGTTPLHYAAAAGWKEVAELLLANKADANAETTSGETPLFLASMYSNNFSRDARRNAGCKDVMELLLNLTEDQKPKFSAIMQDAMEKQKVLRADTSLSREDRRAKGNAIHENTTTRIKALLTGEQFAKWQKMSQRRRSQAAQPQQ